MADEDLVGKVDPINYGYPQYSFAGPQLDDDFRITYPALIPGATYRLQTSFARSRVDGSFEYSLFTAESGQTLDLGEFTPEF